MGSGRILDRIQTIVSKAEEMDREVVRVEADLIRGEQVSFRELQSSWTYTIVAVGSSKIEDIDVEVYKYVDDKWVLIKKDADTENIAVVQIIPGSSALYKIVTKVYRYSPGQTVGHYGLVIYHN
ncbi:MAG: hypothetical protein INR73_03180 [Williamsia sp.]|nr:hypothetical protein [Williamsia sp.]